MAISADIFEKSSKGPILGLKSELRTTSVDRVFEILFKIYLHENLTRNKRNCWSIFGKDEILVKR